MGLFFGDKIMENDKDYLSEEELVNQIITSRMEEGILTLGSKKVWEVIEKFTDYKIRLSYRRIFLNADGIIPKSEI